MRKRGGYPISASPLYRLGSRSKLAKLLGVSNRELRDLQAGDSLYTERDILKANGKGVRHIENPTRALKVVQAKLAKLLMRVKPPGFLFCPVKGRSYVDNAAQHLGARTVRCLDIKAFFPSTPSRRVFWFFRSVMGCEPDLAGLLTRLSTYNGHLPTGSPVSPILSYFAFTDMWAEIAAFCAAKGLTLTVYIDDCTISGPRVTHADMWSVKQTIFGRGLRYHKEKVYRGGFAEVTGAILRDGRITVPNRQMKKLHAIKRDIAVCGGVQASAVLDAQRGLEAQVAHFSAVLARRQPGGDAPL